MTKEFNLSEKITNDDLCSETETKWNFIFVEDVKEFIRLLKEFMQGNLDEEPVIINKFGVRRYPIREIDKLAGDKLK